MTITPQMYDTTTLLGVMQEQEAPSNYFLNLLFPRVETFTTEWVEFEKLSDRRRIAPFVVPGAPGVPTYRPDGSTVSRFKPAYIKAKDPIRAVEMTRRRPGQLLAPTPPSPRQNFDASVANITRFHRGIIERRWEKMAADAALYAAITVQGDDYPTTTVDFARAGNHTVTLGAGSRWGEIGVSIMSSLETFIARMRNASFGGVPNRMTMGSSVWAVVRRDPEILELLDTTVRGTEGTASIKLGLRDMTDVEFVGRIGNLELYVYSDWYEDDTGTQVPFMDPRDILLSGPAMEGVRAFGAILDKAAGFQALPIHTKMWDQEDPSATMILSQSAPLMVPINPNATLRARVIA